jgi:uncharacterized protein YbgA (DUF1722 family)/uncharacterized protein YbbK (DUF523 family)
MMALREPAGAPPADASGPRLRIGISTCLLGRNVRYDGGHKRNAFLMDTLGDYVEWVPVCPEVDIGLGTPRPPIRLEREAGGGVRLVMPDRDEDLTERMRQYAEERVERLRSEGLAGYVLKSGSPSCGMERVKLWDPNGVPSRDGVGLYAEALRRRLPQLPTEEEGRLHDARLRENFITRIFARGRWLDLLAGGLTMHGLMAFHARHKYLLMSREPGAARDLGRLLGGPREGGVETLAATYEEGFSAALQVLPSRGRHANVLQHLAGYVSDDIDAGDRAELAAAIDGYRTGLVPLIVPVTLLRHYVRRLEVEYLADQVYLDPHPHEMMLLNHV